jgi:hypothetical protein
MTSIDKVYKPKLRLIQGGRKTRRVPVIIDGRPIRPLLFTWPGGKQKKGGAS